VFINWILKEIHVKIVYYGAGMSGKTTNLESFYRVVPEDMKSEFVSLKTKGDRTIYYDFFQLELGSVEGLRPRFNLYTVPGQMRYLATRDVILKGADGVVMVVDSQADRLAENEETLADLIGRLGRDGRNIDNFPWVVQYNKRDLHNALPVEELQRRLNRFDVPHFLSIATTGEGVIETVKGLIPLVMENVRKELATSG
jgi:signal recognition particle receptor subunit beta